MEKPRIKLTYQGTDEWGRAVFKSEDGRFYKSVDYLDPAGGFLNADKEIQKNIWNNLHTSEPYDAFEGEPGWPVDLNNFILAKNKTNEADNV